MQQPRLSVLFLGGWGEEWLFSGMSPIARMLTVSSLPKESGMDDLNFCKHAFHVDWCLAAATKAVAPYICDWCMWLTIDIYTYVLFFQRTNILFLRKKIMQYNLSNTVDTFRVSLLSLYSCCLQSFHNHLYIAIE